MSCLRCQAQEIITKSNRTCQTCRKKFCSKCYKIHDKYNECFCEHQDKCYICGGKGFYDYSIKKPVCWGHM